MFSNLKLFHLFRIDRLPAPVQGEFFKDQYRVLTILKKLLTSGVQLLDDDTLYMVRRFKIGYTGEVHTKARWYQYHQPSKHEPVTYHIMVPLYLCSYETAPHMQATLIQMLFALKKEDFRLQALMGNMVGGGGGRPTERFTQGMVYCTLQLAELDAGCESANEEEMVLQHLAAKRAADEQSAQRLLIKFTDPTKLRGALRAYDMKLDWESVRRNV